MHRSSQQLARLVRRTSRLSEVILSDENHTEVSYAVDGHAGGLKDLSSVRALTERVDAVTAWTNTLSGIESVVWVVSCAVQSEPDVGNRAGISVVKEDGTELTICEVPPPGGTGWTKIADRPTPVRRIAKHSVERLLGWRDAVELERDVAEFGLHRPVRHLVGLDAILLRKIAPRAKSIGGLRPTRVVDVIPPTVIQ